jgi:cytochrome c biogenesis factor
MKKWNIANAMIAFTIIILESLPYGAVLNFGEPASDGSIKFIRSTYPYFSLTPFGNANFGPFLTAILSCVLLCLIICSMLTKKFALQNACYVVSILAFLTSLMPLLFGLNSYSVFGLAISVLLVAEVILHSIKKKRHNIPSEQQTFDEK